MALSSVSQQKSGLTLQQVNSTKKFEIFESFLKFSFWGLAKMPKKKATSNKDVYEKAEDLPEGRKKTYDSILEDFDKQGENKKNCYF